MTTASRFLSLLVLAGTSPAFAATDIWSAGTNTTWDTSTANWSGAVFASGDDAVFGSASSLNTITLGGNIIVGDILSNGASNTPATMTITGKAGSSLTLGAGSAGSGNIYDSIGGSSTGYAGNLTYSSANTTGGVFFQLAAGSGTSGTPAIWNMASGKTLTIQSKVDGDIADLGGNTVNLTGAGTVVFGNNGGALTVRNGVFNVNAGTLKFNGGSSKPYTADSSVTVNVATGGTLLLASNSSGGNAVFAEAVTLNGGTLQTGGGGVTTQSGAVTLGGGTSTISNLSGFTAALTVGALAGSGAVNFNSTGSSVIILNATGTYAGTATLNSGSVIRLATGGEFASGTLTLNNSSTLTAVGSTAITVTNAINLQSSGVWTFNFGDASNTGKVTFTQNVGMGGYVKQFAVASGATAEFQGVLSGSAGGVTTTGAGTLILSGANTYVGTTTVTTGTLVAGNNAAFGFSAVSVGATGTLQIGAGGVALASGKTLAVAGTLKFTDETSTITLASAAYSLTGTIDLNGGFAGTSGQTYTLIAGQNGNTDSVTVTNGAAGYAYSFSNGVLTVTAVPEPATYGLLGAGALAAVAFVRRRKRSGVR